MFSHIVKAPSQKGVTRSPPISNIQDQAATTPTTLDLDSSNSSTMMLHPLLNQHPSPKHSPTTTDWQDESYLTLNPNMTLPSPSTNTLSYDNPPVPLGIESTPQTPTKPSNQDLTAGHGITPKAASRPNTLGRDGKTNTLSYDNPEGLQLSYLPGKPPPSPVKSEVNGKRPYSPQKIPLTPPSKPGWEWTLKSKKWVGVSCKDQKIGGSEL